MASQAVTPSISQQDANKEATNVTVLTVAIAIVVVAILLAAASIALGIILCLTRKSVKSVPASKLTPHEGQCATSINDLYTCMHTHTHSYMYMHIYMYMHALYQSIHHICGFNCVHKDLIV